MRGSVGPGSRQCGAFTFGLFLSLLVSYVLFFNRPPATSVTRVLSLHAPATTAGALGGARPRPQQPKQPLLRKAHQNDEYYDDQFYDDSEGVGGAPAAAAAAPRASRGSEKKARIVRVPDFAGHPSPDQDAAAPIPVPAAAVPAAAPAPAAAVPAAAPAPAAAVGAGTASAPVSTSLGARPPREPPAWLLDGSACPSALEQHHPASLSPLDPPHAASATSGAHEEHAGDTLLGPCECPLRSPPPREEWEFDCGDYDWRILSDLAPWHGVDITHEMLDKAYELNTANVPPGYHFSISGGRVHVKFRPDPMSVYHGKLLDMLRTVADMVPLPDCEFILHAWDHAKVWRQDPIPVFSFIRDAAKNDITVPYPYRWGSGDFELDMAGDCVPYESRGGAGKVLWRGGCTGPATGYHDPFWATYLRYRATVLTREHPDVLDVGLVEECVNRDRAGPVLPSVDLVQGVCHHKHLLLLDGNTASGRSALWVHSGAVVLKPDSVFSEWFYHLMRPWVHYVPVREFLEDLPQQAAWIVREAPPHVGQCLARNLKLLAKKHVRKEAVACYWWRLLTAWAAKQKQGSRTEGMAPI